LNVPTIERLHVHPVVIIALNSWKDLSCVLHYHQAQRKVCDMVQLDLKLPDSLAREAQAAGLLTPQAIEQLLREEIRRRRVSQLFEAADRLAALDAPPLTEAEVETEIQAVREARRSYSATGR